MSNTQKNPKMRHFIIIALLLTQLACNAITGDRPTRLAPDVSPTSGLQATATSPVAQPTLDRPRRPVSSSSPGIACFGTFGSGVTCIEDNEWVTYARQTSNLGGDQIHDIVVCPDKRLLIAHTFGISAYDGTTWKEYESGWGVSRAEALACNERGEIWVAHFKGVSHFNGDTWKTYSAREFLAQGESANDLVKDVAIAPDGKVWVVTANSVAVFENGKWTTYQEGLGFDDRYFFENIALDTNGLPWVTTTRGLFAFDGESWQPYSNRDTTSPEALAIDAEERVWVGTLSKGVYVLEEGGWLSYNRENSELSSNHIHRIDIDGQGRVWIATEWGLNVFDKYEWHIYRMDNTNLVDHDIRALGIIDGGPPLPEPHPKSPGSITGQVVNEDGIPVARAGVEICVERLYKRSYDAPPCAGQPFSRSTETDDEGKFHFEELPSGYYALSVYDGEVWTQMVGEVGNASMRIPVLPDEDTYLGEFILKPAGE